ncbi:hypothetical protein ACFC1B_13105 [Streptomyces xiamenensis]|uniref:hypothetical protein n=1 Tax=Streptomyces xiamenensis TaxID=408015 RepID=UPI0035DD8BCD
MLITAAAVLLAWAALERNHRRHRRPTRELAGSTDLRDRDAERTTADLRVAKECPTHGARPGPGGPSRP